jgi:hypothetical protein
MSTLLDAILGTFNSGQSGGFIPGSMPRDAPSSGYLPEDQVSTPPADPYGNPVGGAAPGVPLPRPRPPEAGPAAISPGETPDAAPLDLRPGDSGATGGGFATALGLNPNSMRRISAGLAGGLSHVQNSPFAGQVAANAAGGAFAAGNKSDETAVNQALKLRQIELRGGARADKASVIDEETRRAAQADRDGTLAQARAAVVRDPSKRAAIIARLQQLGIAF